MNRRSFLTNSALALFGFSVLPPAKTYERIWKAQRAITFRIELNPAWVNAEYETVFLHDPTVYQSLTAMTFKRDPGQPSKKLIKQGFVIAEDLYPPRYKSENGVLVHVPAFIELDTSDSQA